MLGVPRFKAASGHAYVALLCVFVVNRGFVNYIERKAFVIYWTRLFVLAIAAFSLFRLVCVVLLKHLGVMSLDYAIHIHHA